MSENTITSTEKCSAFLAKPSAYQHDDISDLESKILVLVHSLPDMTILRLVELVRADTIGQSLPFIHESYVFAAVNELIKLKYLQYHIVSEPILTSSSGHKHGKKTRAK